MFESPPTLLGPPDTEVGGMGGGAERKGKEQTELGRRGAEVFKGELTGSGGSTDRKQRRSLSSHHSWVKPRG